MPVKDLLSILDHPRVPVKYVTMAGIKFYLCWVVLSLALVISLVECGLSIPDPSLSIVPPAKPFTLCDGSDDKVTFSCVYSLSPSDGFSSTLSGIPGAPAARTSSSDDGALVTDVYEFRPTEAGVKDVYCVLSSSAEASFSKNVSIEFEIYALPTAVEFMSNDKAVNNGSTLTVTMGDNLEVQCRVSGGDPIVPERTTLTCGNYTESLKSEISKMTFSAIKELNNQRCTCTYEHAGNCSAPVPEYFFTFKIVSKGSYFSYVEMNVVIGLALLITWLSL